jgi:hypothetical protein
LLELVDSWHQAVSVAQGGTVVIAESFYLLLQWDRKSGRYQLFQFPSHLPPAKNLRWLIDGRRIQALNNTTVVIEWYGLSGGQLKYYPSAEDAIWVSPIFQLEPLPQDERGYGLQRRVMDYFPELWHQAETLQKT